MPNQFAAGHETPFEFDLFLSHNGADKTWTERLASAIEADRDGRPLRVFFDRWDIPPGGDVPLKLEAGLQNSRHVGLVLTTEGLASDWVALERSTAIYKDPAARARRLIPILRKDCQIPDMLARLRYIDFRRDADFEGALNELLDFLRGRIARRGSRNDPASLDFREDAALLLRHRAIFDRPAFATPCVDELVLEELNEAVEGAIAAITTGSLYSRSGNLLAAFSAHSSYRLPRFRESFLRILYLLAELRRAITEFSTFFNDALPTYGHHRNFYAMVTSMVNAREARFDAGDKSRRVIECVTRMDVIDGFRNQIVEEVNTLLILCGEANLLSNVPSSSDAIRERDLFEIPSAEVVADDREISRVSDMSQTVLDAADGLGRLPENAPAHEVERPIESMVMAAVRRDRSSGINGEEACFHKVRHFPSGAIVGLITLWPGHGEDLFAIVVDEKFPEYFALLKRTTVSAEEAAREWSDMDEAATLRGRDQAMFLQETGWKVLVPRRDRSPVS